VQGGVTLNDPGSSGSLAIVEAKNQVDVVKAAEVCPGECIFIEMDVPLIAQ
jgi:ferredoxin